MPAAFFPAKKGLHQGQGKRQAQKAPSKFRENWPGGNSVRRNPKMTATQTIRPRRKREFYQELPRRKMGLSSKSAFPVCQAAKRFAVRRRRAAGAPTQQDQEGR